MRRAALAALLLVAGCSYYNGMYNTNRLAKQAEKAEREGRQFDAQSFWGQAAVKAESVLVHQPDSKWADDARFIRGRALARLRQCANALPALQESQRRLADSARRELATFLVARCRLELGDSARAAEDFALLVRSPDPERRREARFEVAREQIRQGRDAEGLALLDSLGDWRVPGLRMLGLAGVGRTPELLAVADSLIARGDTAAPWRATLTRLGARQPLEASHLLDRLRALPGVDPAEARRWLADDALRLAVVDSARGRHRLAQLDSLANESGVAAGTVRVGMMRARLSQAATPADLNAELRVLDSLETAEGLAGVEAGALASVVRVVARAADSVTPGAPQGDLALFAGAEWARDSLGATRLAAALFRGVVAGWPDSPYAPKAVLAGRQLDSTWIAASQPLVDSTYRQSPYLAVLRGDQAEAYRALEDSLGRYLATVTPAHHERHQLREPGGRRVPADTAQDGIHRRGPVRRPVTGGRKEPSQ